MAAFTGQTSFALKNLAPVSQFRRPAAAALFSIIAAASLSACQGTGASTDVIRVERAQGSTENISSLSSVIAANPQDPESYNVRGSAYGRAGEYRRCRSG